MGELVHEAFLPVNVLCSTLFILIVVYWITVIVGLMDVSFLDVDWDVEGDVDADAEIDVEAGGVWRGVLEFFYIGEVPVMVLISIMVLCMWIVSLIGNYYLNPGRNLVFGIGILAGNIVVSGLVTRIFAAPLKKFFSFFNKDYNAPRKVVGRICTILTSEVSDRLGQAEVRTEGAPIVLNVKTEDGQVMRKGDEAVVVGQDKGSGVYYIAPVDLEI